MENEENKAPSAEELEAKAKAEAEKADAEAKTAETASQEALKKELEKVNKGKFTKRERLEFEKRKIDDQLSKIDEEEGISSVEDDTPVTVGMLDKLNKEKSKKTSLDLAENIEDETERELAKHYLQNRIVPSGNPEEDLKMARATINSLKNAQIAEELSRKQNPKKGNAPGNPAKHEAEFVPTPEESIFMSTPYNMSKNDVIKARQKSQQQ